MPEAKEPLAHRPPEVRALVDQLFESGWSPGQVEQLLRRLARDERERVARGLAHVPPDSLVVPYSSLSGRRRWLKRQGVPVEPGEGWRWWEEDDGRRAGAVLRALVAWEVTAGGEWGPVSPRLAELVGLLSEMAPGLPPATHLALAAIVERAERLGEPERTRRLAAVGRFLGCAPWESADAADRYARLTASSDRIVLDGSGLPTYVVTVSATAVATSVASASLTVGRDDEGAGH